MANDQSNIEEGLSSFSSSSSNDSGDAQIALLTRTSENALTQPNSEETAPTLNQIKVENANDNKENSEKNVGLKRPLDEIKFDASTSTSSEFPILPLKQEVKTQLLLQSSSCQTESITTDAQDAVKSKIKRIKLEEDDGDSCGSSNSSSSRNNNNNSPQTSAVDFSQAGSSKGSVRSTSQKCAITVPSTCSSNSSGLTTSSKSIASSSSSGHSSLSSLRSSSLRSSSYSSSSTSSSSMGKLSKKSHRQMIRLISPNSHNHCYYVPGAYSSHGQLSSQLRRHCPLSYCCHCQHPYLQGRLPLAVPTITGAGSSSSSQPQLDQQQAIQASSNNSIPTTSNTRSDLISSSATFSHEPGSSSSVVLKSAHHHLLQPVKTPESLLEIASRLVAEHIPYEYIEQRYSCIPEPVQRRIIFWSFPRDESYIRLYSSISSIFKQDSVSGSTATNNYLNNLQAANVAVTLSPSSNVVIGASTSSSSSSASTTAFSTISSSLDGSQQQQAVDTSTSSLFNSGLLLMLSGAVHQVLQVGFNLSGVVTNAASFNSISSGSVGGSYYSSHASSSSSGPSAALLDYASPSTSSLFFSPEYNTRYNFSSLPYLNSREASLYSRSKATTTSYLVSITFDRCKITSVTCTCNSRDYHLFWCEHVVALALYRIRRPLAIELRVPISESLLEFDREQLQKLLQYLIAEHHVQILPTVQRLADELSHKQSSINRIPGAPDPTAGACVFGRHDWYLNEEKIGTQIRDLVKYVTVTEAKQIIQLFYKIVEMLKIKDSNGPRFLRIITEQFLYSYSHFNKPEETSLNFDPYIFLWDHLTNLWIYIVTDLSMSPLNRVQWRELFRHWSHLANCPREDTHFSLALDSFPVASATSDPRFGHASDYGPQSSRHTTSTDNYLNQYDGYDASEMDYLSHRRMSSAHSLPPPLPPALPSAGTANASLHHHNHHHRLRKRRILERAFDATFLTWDHVHLQLILRQDGPVDRSTHVHISEHLYDREGFPIWKEHLPTAAVRIASLRVNGHSQEALRLAMAVVRNLKLCQQQKNDFQKYKPLSRDYSEYEFAQSYESWIGNPIDPIGVIFDTLAEASLTPDSKPLDSYYALVAYDKKLETSINNHYSLYVRNLLADLFLQYNEHNILERNAEETLHDRPKYKHVRVPGATYRQDKDKNKDSFLSAAVTVALIGLAQLRRSPDMDSQRDKTFRQEARLIRKLLDIRLDSTLLRIIRKQANYLLEHGLLSYKKTALYEMAQIPGLVRYMFGALFPTEPGLAFDIGLQSLSFFSYKEEMHRSRADQERLQKYRSIMCYYLDLQLILAKTMLLAARNDPDRLKKIFVKVKDNVNNANYLNKLAHELYQYSLQSGSSGTRHEHLLHIAYNFGLHLAQVTLNESTNDNNNRKSIIQWLVSCASEINFENILMLMKNWKDYFTPSEAVRQVATTVLAPNFNVRMCNHMFRQEELATCARTLAMECANEDPANCALNALSLCEKDAMAFDAISIYVEAAGAQGNMNAHQLFTVARYMEHQGASDRACKIALLAASQVFIPLSADTHHLIGDLQWACSLAQCLGHRELTDLINILVKNVRCAPVLADMIRRCTQFPPQPIHPSKHMMLHSNMRHQGFVPAPDAANLTYMDHLTMEERLRRRQTFKTYRPDQHPIATLLNAAVLAYIETVMKRLEHISPRHYSDFIEFLTRAQETILLAPDGTKEFATLLDKIKTLYKGKKKLMSLVRERFRLE